MSICPFTKVKATDDSTGTYRFEDTTYRIDAATVAEITRVPPSLHEQKTIQKRLNQYMGPIATIANSRENTFRFKVV